MGYLTDNPWIRYVDRTYQQIKDRVLTQLQYMVPELTDHTESNPFVKILGIWAGIAEMLGYYIDNAGRESFLSACRLYRSAIKIARLMDYRVHGMYPYSVNALFTLNAAAPSDILIPLGTVVSDGAIEYRTSTAALIPTGETIVSVPAVQFTPVSFADIGVTNGTLNQEIPVGTGNNVVDGSVNITVNSVVYTQVDTFAYSLPNNLHFLQSVNEQGVIIVRFGDGINGNLPAAGLNVQAQYNSTLGASIVPLANTITTIVSDISLPNGYTLSVNNPTAPTGGAGIESLQQLKQRIPLYRATLGRAVSASDYSDLAETYVGVAKAGIVHECGTAVKLFIVPNGGGVASGALLDEVADFMDDKIMITTELEVLAAGEIMTVLSLDLEVLPNYLRNTVVNAVKTNIVAYMSYLNQNISGRFRIGDLYEIIESTPGVKNSAINSLVPLPYATPLDDDMPALLWDRSLLSGSIVQKKWQVVMVSSTSYQLFRDNSYVGTYNTGVQVALPEITFKINAGGYTANDSWTFITYIYNARTIELQEPSVLVTTTSNITINATGGL